MILSRLSNAAKDTLEIKGEWYYLDYALIANPIPLGWFFRNNSNSILELTNVHLHYANSYIKEIPIGYSTICQFNIIKGELNIEEGDNWTPISSSQVIYPFSKAEMREKQIKSVIE